MDRRNNITNEKKLQLYESAVQAWERGDVTSALSRMDVLVGMERDAPDTDSGRGGTYRQRFPRLTWARAHRPVRR